MASWGLEEHAENLRRAAPEFWAAFLNELSQLTSEAATRLINTPAADVLVVQGEVRSLAKLIGRLRDAARTVEQVKAGTKRNE